jgi:site-specific recombinase XerD/ribosomal protein L40E
MQAFYKPKMEVIDMQQPKTADMGEYNLALAMRCINNQATIPENKALALEWDKKKLFAENAKPNTRANKLLAISYFLKWCGERNLKNLEANDTIDYKQHLLAAKFSIKGSTPKKYSPQTIAGRLSILKQFFNWLEKPETMQWFKMKRTTNGRLNAQQILSQQEILKMITAANSKRDKALIAALWETGARAGEFLSLKIGDLHIEGKGELISFTVSGKTGERQCFLVASVPSVLQWLEEHPNKNDKSAWLWAKGTHNADGARLTNNALRAMLLATAKRAGITKPNFAHALRHSRATFCAKAGQNEMVLRQLFGWSKTSQMPAVYISLCGADAKNAMLELAGQRAPEKEQPLQPKKCIRCGTVAPIDAIVCQRCFFPMNAEAAQQQEDEQTAKFKAMVYAALEEREKQRVRH